MTATSVTAATLKHWLDTDQAVLIDVREPAEFSTEHVPGAVSMPLSGICCARLPQPAGKKIVLQCKAGRRGDTACEKLLAEQPDLELYNLEGGMDAWKALDFPLESGTRRVLPLDRQLQLTIGSILLAISLAGYYSTPSVYFCVTGGIGLGLTIAGSTGFCGLSLLLARMPWNQKT